MRKLTGQSLLFLLIVLLFSCGKEEKALYLSGRIEGDEYDIGAKIGGKVVEVRVEEGKEVRKGEVLAKLDSKELEAKLRRAEAVVRSLREKLRALEVKRELLVKELDINLKASVKRREVARDELQGLEHTKRELEVRKEKLLKDLKRFRELFSKGVIPQSKLEEIETEVGSLEERIRALGKAMEELRKKVELAELEIELAREKRKEIEALEKEIASLRERVREAEAGVEEVRALLEDTILRSPIEGTVVEKFVEEGEVVPPGKVLFTVVNLDELYFKGYLPETKLGLLRLGQEAYVKVDSFPERKFPAVVSYISDRAEFTPKEVQTKEARVKQVFAVKMRLKENPGHVLKPGMPAEAYVELR
ncbi:HlyD family secretion protein [Hydrogenivirga caldilitoris]|uniref:HlyD family secretion protein n=1 Tax=Hydrogenivirga caldilitoris TaxID=246264 RepID=A0A497XPY6_9AQUI|nr:efflux RND transporter periplasmic adaptor subunit [Hydrogenivirga caldilitoris]RLJ70304.1 HlyD family secretion protein [Hydrogenivirga caldilitoris]